MSSITLTHRLSEMAIATWKLEELRYPRAAQFKMEPAEIVALVAFLEDRHVRAWDVDRRGPLRKDGPTWPETFASYLEVRTMRKGG